MAINDLMAELQKDSIKLDDESERKVNLLSSNVTVPQSVLRLSLNACPILPSSLLCFTFMPPYLALLQVVHMLLKLLEDKNGEVQNLTVKW